LEQEIAKYFWSIKDSILVDVFSIISGRLYISITSSILIIYAVIRLKKRVLLFLLAAAISWGVSDLLCYRVLKPAIKRLRPAVELNLNSSRDNLVKKSSSTDSSFQLNNYSMPSNHASNSFAFFIVYFCLVKRYWGIALFNSALISVSRIIIVKHYPTDVFAGIAAGIIIGLCVIFIFSGFGYKPNPPEATKNS
jgi:membrane-associated phospholipid phosphatase